MPSDPMGDRSRQEDALVDAPPVSSGDALRAPSRLHAFNRYEIKYLVDVSAVAQLRDDLAQRLDHDEQGDAGYGVWSLYYDTPQLRFYWEKVEGIRFRRKLRIRHYGEPATLRDTTPVYVEIKQRVNRVTQKRRVALPHELARRLCDGRQEVPHHPAERPFLDEVLGLVGGLDLRPVTVTGYHRLGFAGRDAETGLRVTIDRRVRGRDHDLDLSAEAENRYILPAGRAIVEVKANDRVPYWFTDLAAARGLQVVRISKYCQSIEMFGRVPRSVFHIGED
jgi:hypothetical protein